MEYVTGLNIESLCADLTTFVPGRQLEDDGNVLLRFDNGAKGVLFASQISVGEENGLKLRVYGEHGGLEWYDEMSTEPSSLGNYSIMVGVQSSYTSAFGGVYVAKPLKRRFWKIDLQEFKIAFDV